MPPLKDTFSKLTAAIVGTKSTNIDMKLDAAVRSINAYRTQTGRNSYIDLVKSLITKGTDVKTQALFTQGATSPAAFGQGGRLLRYRTYDAIVTNISYCKRALDVLVDNILSPDDITKVALEIKPKSFLETSNDDISEVKKVKEITRALKLEDRLELIVKETLKFGDFFVEIADSKTALTSRTFLTEEKLIELHKKKVEESIIDEKEVIISTEAKNGTKETKQTIKILMDYTSFVDEAGPGSKTEEEEENKPQVITDVEPKTTSDEIVDKVKQINKSQINLKNYRLLIYEPRRVIKLQSDMFPLCFGYLVFPMVAIVPGLAIQDQAVNQICKTILASVTQKIPDLHTTSIKMDELKDIVASMLNQADSSYAMNIRFVPEHRMQHFRVPATKYFPYGESIFDSVQYTAKVMIAMETALAIQRLNRSTEKRKIAIEIGLPRDAKVMVENLKEQFRKRKISLDSFGSVDTIPSMITTFEDLYIPQKDGKPYVDITPFTDAGAEARNKVDELKFLRDSAVAGLGVPASFLNIEENLSNKAALSEENILFARTVIRHQKYFSDQINELIDKILSVIYPEQVAEILDKILITFAPPKSLQFEREAKYTSDLANLVETLERIGIPRDYSVKKYLTQFDWQDLQKYKTDEKIDTSLKTETQPPGTDMGMGGGLGMPVGGLGPSMPGTF